jgi:hypothetical protein
MRLMLRKITILVIAAALASSGAASFAHAKISLAGTDRPLLHESHPVEHYADIAIEPGEQDCLHSIADAPSQHSHNDGLCKKCCAACAPASLIPSAPFPILALSEARGTFLVSRNTLVAHTVPTDPGIPKPLS